MRKLKIEIYNLLKTVCDDVFFEDATDSAKFPYLVYNLSQAVRTENQILFNLDVDIWDKNISSSRVETLFDDLRKLDKTNILNSDLQCTVRFDRYIDASEGNKELKRKTVMFILRYMERS